MCSVAKCNGMVGSLRLVAASVFVFAALVVSSLPGAEAAPHVQDPCAQAGRDSCGTAGVGFYRSSRYGVRWFGDYRGAIVGEPHEFCVDLGFWYASRGYRYRLQASAPLHSRAGRTVPRENRRRLAYALWRYGRSSEAGRQAAVMLYVHSLVGDARPGELDPAVLGRPAASLYRRIVRDSARYHGPYRIEARLPARLLVGRPATAAIRVVSAHGYPLPYLSLRLSAAGVDGLPVQAQTNRAGVARVLLTPMSASSLRLQIATAPLALSEPRVYAPTAAAAVAHGQRLAVPAAERVASTVVRTVKARPRLTATVSRPLVRPGARISERLRIRGLGTSSTAIELELFGPFGSRAAIGCSRQRLRWRGRIVARGDSELTTEAVKLTRAGFYAYRQRVLGSGLVIGSTSRCASSGASSLVVPLIVTGRGDRADPVSAPVAGADTPTRVRIPSLGINAPVSPAGIDVKHGVLGIPADIHRVGWWRDGSTPASAGGVILIAGHRDSARAGAGAFYRLGRARAGTLVRLTTATRHSSSYRVTSVRSYRKQQLPTSIYASSGPTRLVLVTCGGPFNPTTGHYRDNIVVTAVPTS